MKKFFIAVSIIFCITAFTKNDAQALTVGDEIVIGESYAAMLFHKFQLSGSTEFVLDKKIKLDGQSEETTIKGQRTFLKSTISLSKNLDFYAKVGCGKDKLEINNKVESEPGLAYGGGFKANLISWDDTGVNIGVDAQYLRFDTGIDSVNINSTNYWSVTGDFTVNQWQAAMFIVKEFISRTCYGGCSYADSTLRYSYDTSGNIGSGEGGNKNVLGIFAGTNINVTDTVIFFAEGHLLDESSISVGLNARF